jgi:DNA-binding response OmpR family regulator/HPt (histidine-containing phosphotransfer) domain-containing protein
MEQIYAAAATSLLLLQHQPAIAPAVQKAVSPFNCRVTPVSDGGQFLQIYNESQLNPLLIFGQTPVSCLLLDLVFASQKTMEVLRQLRERFSALPPVIGLCRPQTAKHVDKYYEKGFNEMIVFTGETQKLRDSLKKYMGRTARKPDKFQKDIPIDTFDHLPVINLKTYSIFAELATLQQFPMEDLFSSFMDEMEVFINRLIRNFEEGNINDCEKLSISIKSLSGTLGASQLAQTARYVEVKLKEKQWQLAGQWLPYLIEKYLILREYMSEMPAVQKRSPILA